jgi:hypothetical protein
MCPLASVIGGKRFGMLSAKVKQRHEGDLGRFG